MSGKAAKTLWTKFDRCDWRERRCLVEALILLVLAAVAIRMMPLRWLGWIASIGPFGSDPTTADRAEDIGCMVGWAVDRAARRSPMRAKCFEQGLAAQVMLRRRGIDSAMFYGVGTKGSRRLHAHVWIETECSPIIGDPDPGGFALLATWPAGRQAVWARCAG